MTMLKLLTFSIAAYNVETTLPRLMDAILTIMNRDKIEAIIVNDGSTDHTLEMARAYEKKYPDCVRVIDKKNGGHGSTINAGIKNAAGKYFRPVDGDDWLNPESVDKLIEKLENENSDIILADYFRCYETRNLQEPFRYELVPACKLKSGEKYSFDDIVGKIEPMKYHMMIYRTQFLRDSGIELSEHCFYVDTELNLLPLINAKTLIYFDYPIYCYRLGYDEQSVSRSSRQRHIADSERVAERLLEFYRDNEVFLRPEMKKYLKNGTRGICMWHYMGLCLFEPNKENKKRLMEFDRHVYSMAPEVHHAMVWDIRNTGKRYSFLLFVMRASGYLLYPLALKLIR